MNASCPSTAAFVRRLVPGYLCRNGTGSEPDREPGPVSGPPEAEFPSSNAARKVIQSFSRRIFGSLAII
jgi:hypothetical protein